MCEATVADGGEVAKKELAKTLATRKAAVTLTKDRRKKDSTVLQRLRRGGKLKPPPRERLWIV